MTKIIPERFNDLPDLLKTAAKRHNPGSDGHTLLCRASDAVRVAIELDKKKLTLCAVSLAVQVLYENDDTLSVTDDESVALRNFIRESI